MPRHSSQFTRKQNQKKQKKPKPPPPPPPPPPIHPIHQVPPTERVLHTRGFTNRIQEYLGTHVPFEVTPNRLATMPQNYYKFDPNLINRQMMYQNFSGNGVPLTLPEFKQQLDQLYRQRYLNPIPLSARDETDFNYMLEDHGIEADGPVRLHMQLPFPNFIPIYSIDGRITINTAERWGTLINGSLIQTLPVTTVNQIDRFILPRGYPNNFDHNEDVNIGTRRIRALSTEELEWLIHCIEHPGVSPPPNTRLGIIYDWGVYHTYAELAQAMGVPELQVANFDAAPFMTSLLSPHNDPRRNPTRKCRASF